MARDLKKSRPTRRGPLVHSLLQVKHSMLEASSSSVAFPCLPALREDLIRSTSYDRAIERVKDSIPSCLKVGALPVNYLLIYLIYYREDSY